QRLAVRLQDLGYGVVRKGNFFEVEGVPPSVVDKFSRRQQVIEKAIAAQGLTDPKQQGEVGARTREHKAQNFTRDQLRRLWAGRLTPEERSQLARVRAQAGQREQQGWEPQRVSAA